MGKPGVGLYFGESCIRVAITRFIRREHLAKCSFKHVISHIICLCYLCLAFFLFFLLLFWGVVHRNTRRFGARLGSYTDHAEPQL